MGFGPNLFWPLRKTFSLLVSIAEADPTGCPNYRNLSQSAVSSVETIVSTGAVVAGAWVFLFFGGFASYCPKQKR